MTAWLRRPLPARPLALLRILTATYAAVWLVVRFPHLVDVADLPAERWEPVGVLAPLGTAPSGSLLLGLAGVTVALAVLAAVGWRHRVIGPLFAVALLVVTTWRTSWGNVLHTEPLLVLHVAVLAFVPCAAVWSLDARRDGRRGPGAEPGPDARFAWPVRVMALVTVATYVLAGVAKLRLGGLGWVDGDVVVHQVAYDNVRKAALGDTSSTIGLWAVARPWLLRPFGLLTLVVELGAPIALLGATWARVWVGAAWAFHLGILVLMAILFPYPLLLVGLLPVLFAAGRLPAWLEGPGPVDASPVDEMVDR